jgi:hypothetical protein
MSGNCHFQIKWLDNPEYKNIVAGHLILKQQFPAILWQKLQHAVFVYGSFHFSNMKIRTS